MEVRRGELTVNLTVLHEPMWLSTVAQLHGFVISNDQIISDGELKTGCT
jgi:hypothetical protein